jgi:ABC-type uncharacterized transport system auxiliary subunit
MMRVTLAMAALLALVACSPPTVPDMTYFRLPPPAAEVAQRAPTFAIPVDVSVFGADGLYAEQAIIYSADADGGTLHNYHYQLWIDPPARLLQRRLIGALRDAKAAPLVTDRLPASTDALRVSGLILRFDRAHGADGYAAKVVLQLRVERAGELLSERVYRAEAPANGDELKASVAAFGTALDRIYGEFLGDLALLQLTVVKK